MKTDKPNNKNNKNIKNIKIPFFDRTREDQPILPQLQNAFERIIHSGQYILGPEVQRLEHTLTQYLNTPHAIALSSCSDALLSALLALDTQPGDEIIIPAYTFFATAGSIARLGARPIFADIDPHTFNIDPKRLEQHIGPRTKGIIAVHLFGCPADIPTLQQIADQRKLWLLEDSAQALGTWIKTQGNIKKMAGTFGQAGCFSFFPTKNLGGFGDSGLLVTNDNEMAARVRKLRVHGSSSKHHHELLGGNFRMDALQAALLSEKILYMERNLERRREIAAFYDKYFQEQGLIEAEGIELGARPAGHSFNQYIIRIHKKRRDFVKAYLEEQGIGTEIYYPKPLHLQPVFQGLGYREGAFEEAERASRETLALPIFPGLLDEECQYIAEQLERALLG